MSTQITIPASANQTKLDILDNGNALAPTITFAPSGTDKVIDAVVTEITTSTTTTTTQTTTTTTSTTTKTPTTSTSSTTTKSADVTLFGSAAIATPKLNDAEPLETGLKFQSSAAGFIKGIRFYKATGFTGVRVASLWDTIGTKLATATFVETASGWQQVLFTSPVAIAANTVYTASVFSASGDYVAKIGGLSTVVNSAPLKTVSGSNGVFQYANSGFPTGTYQNSNYYVDVVFSATGTNSPTTTTTTTKAPSTTTTTTLQGSTTSTTTGVISPTGIQGFGAQAVGGANTTDVRTVTSKAQFDAALGSNRTIKFGADVTFADRVDITYSYLTIDGNGYDVTINNGVNGDGISFNGPNAHHCILKGIRVINSGGDGINVIDGSHDIVIDHCSSYDNRDGNIDVAGDDVGITKNVTVQWCFIGRGQANDASFSGCSLITGQSVSFHHNLFAPATVGGVGERCPLVHCNYSPVGNPNADVRYNLIWKFGRDNGTSSGFGVDSAYGAATNAVGNYVYTTGGSNDNGVTTSAYGEPSGLLYASGNVSGNNVNANADSNHSEYSIPVYAQIPAELACDAARKVLQQAGTPKKNTYEQTTISSINLPNC